jgi:hypothetical protein
MLQQSREKLTEEKEGSSAVGREKEGERLETERIWERKRTKDEEVA